MNEEQLDVEESYTVSAVKCCIHASFFVMLLIEFYQWCLLNEWINTEKCDIRGATFWENNSQMYGLEHRLLSTAYILDDSGVVLRR